MPHATLRHSAVAPQTVSAALRRQRSPRPARVIHPCVGRLCVRRQAEARRSCWDKIGRALPVPERLRCGCCAGRAATLAHAHVLTQRLASARSQGAAATDVPRPRKARYECLRRPGGAGWRTRGKGSLGRGAVDPPGGSRVPDAGTPVCRRGTPSPSTERTAPTNATRPRYAPAPALSPSIWSCRRCWTGEDTGVW